jgi:hypothetical protein
MDGLKFLTLVEIPPLSLRRNFRAVARLKAQAAVIQ